MALKIYDISHWQTIDWSKFTADCVIMKVSQGILGVDPMFQQYKAGARKKGILCGYYHFANGADPIQEATHFVKTVGDIQQGELVALDYEIHLPNPVDWCLKWLQEVERQVGFKPLLYINSSTARSFNWQPVINNNTGLWIASYGLNIPQVRIIPPQIGQWPFYAIWQYSSRGRTAGISGYVDLDYTKMSLDVLKEYGK